MRQAIIFTLLSCTLISAAPAVAHEKASRHPPFDWVLVDGDHTNMSGSTDMLQRARAQQHNGERLLFVTRDGRSWVFREPAVLDRVRASWAPAQELGKKMEALGKQMEGVGTLQSQIGSKMSLIGTKMGKIGTELGRLRPDDPARETLQDQLGRLQREMEPLQEEMDKLSRQMQPFSDEMSRHGKEMGKLSEKAQAELERIVDAALAQGLGQEIK